MISVAEQTTLDLPFSMRGTGFIFLFCAPESRKVPARAVDRGRKDPAQLLVFVDGLGKQSTGFRAPMAMPRRRAIEERTCSTSSFSPSISLLLRTSAVRV